LGRKCTISNLGPERTQAWKEPPWEQAARTVLRRPQEWDRPARLFPSFIFQPKNSNLVIPAEKGDGLVWETPFEPYRGRVGVKLGCRARLIKQPVFLIRARARVFDSPVRGRAP